LAARVEVGVGGAGVEGGPTGAGGRASEAVGIGRIALQDQGNPLHSSQSPKVKLKLALV